MCGLIGMVAKRRTGFFGPYNKIFSDMLYIDALRGDDSTGVFLVDRDGEVHGAKDAFGSSYFLFTKEYLALEKKINVDARIVIGHNRKATQGKIVSANAHPFVVKDEVILVHNGTLTNDKPLEEDAEVDSEILAKYLHRETPSDIYDGQAWGKVFSKVLGAYALMWYDLRHNKLFVIRNSQRPLMLAETDDAFIMCSEGPFIHAALARNSTKVEKWLTVPEKKLWIFDLEANENVAYKEVEVPTIPFQIQAAAPTTWTSSTTHSPNNTGAISNIAKGKLNKKYVGREIEVEIEDVSETGAKEIDFFFFGKSFQIPWKAEIVGLIPNHHANEIVNELSKGKSPKVKCKILSVETVGSNRTRTQINVTPSVCLTHETTTVH